MVGSRAGDLLGLVEVYSIFNSSGSLALQELLKEVFLL